MRATLLPCPPQDQVGALVRYARRSRCSSLRKNGEAHAAYQRGEIGRMLTELGVAPPWDTMAVCLHQGEPGRRLAEAS